ncbi:MAG TPA: ubiquinone biosynthesis regulatory protein kinase UbiB, partial [Gammaproteobacteria bacterium]|nr:ubiquinone biosynthesis regulatory protein kinase UbiB [Gammaproteobacteria bacterium]
MPRPTQIFRLIHINVVLVRHGLDELILATHLLRPVRFMMYLTPWYWLRNRSLERGVRIRRALEDLGPIFVKFGQILSTRRDLLPDDIAEELIRLQDQVPPFDSVRAQQIIEKSFGKPVSELFASFDAQPLASASIAQVHAATMHDGREVVVKVLRPDIEPVIQRDLDLLYTIAGLAERFWQDGKRLHPVDVIGEFDKVIHDELDLVREAANATQLRRNFEGSELLYVPKIDWDYAHKNALVMERISGIPIGDIDK